MINSKDIEKIGLTVFVISVLRILQKTFKEVIKKCFGL